MLSLRYDKQPNGAWELFPRSTVSFYFRSRSIQKFVAVDLATYSDCTIIVLDEQESRKFEIILECRKDNFY